MRKYLKLFENHSGYTAYMGGEGVALPNVSYCEDTLDVHYGYPSDIFYATYEITDTVNPTFLFIGYETGDGTFTLDGNEYQISEMDKEIINND